MYEEGQLKVKYYYSYAINLTKLEDDDVHEMNNNMSKLIKVLVQMYQSSVNSESPVVN